MRTIRFITVPVLMSLWVFAGLPQDAPGENQPVVTTQPAEKAPHASAQLLAQQININESDLQAKGRVTVHTLSPLHILLQFEQLSGTPERIKRLLSFWMPKAAEWMLDPSISKVEAQQVEIEIIGRENRVAVEQLAIQNGVVKQVRIHRTEEGNWHVHVEKMQFQQWPVKLPEWPSLTGMGCVHLVASGKEHLLERVQAERLFADGMAFEQLDVHWQPFPWVFSAALFTTDLAAIWPELMRRPEAQSLLKEIRQRSNARIERITGTLQMDALTFSGEVKERMLRLIKGKTLIKSKSLKTEWQVDAKNRPWFHGGPVGQQKIEIRDLHLPLSLQNPTWQVEQGRLQWCNAREELRADPVQVKGKITDKATLEGVQWSARLSPTP